MRSICRDSRDEASLTSMMNAPRSLFDRPSPTLMKIRQELRLHKYRGGLRPNVPSLKPPMLITKTTPEPDVPEWLIHEDWIILQVIYIFKFAFILIIYINLFSLTNILVF